MFTMIIQQVHQEVTLIHVYFSRMVGGGGGGGGGLRSMSEYVEVGGPHDAFYSPLAV